MYGWNLKLCFSSPERTSESQLDNPICLSEVKGSTLNAFRRTDCALGKCRASLGDSGFLNENSTLLSIYFSCSRIGVSCMFAIPDCKVCFTDTKVKGEIIEQYREETQVINERWKRNFCAWQLTYIHRRSCSDFVSNHGTVSHNFFH